jgi:nucleoside-diphosphate-sugar epimerase
MRVFVTGASGFIGSATVPLLLEAGHEVTGLARSDAAAAALEAAGVRALRGSIDEPDVLREAAAASDGVIHLAYNHDFSQYEQAGQTDRIAIEAMGEALAGSDRPLVITSGTLGVTFNRVATEEDPTQPSPRSPGSVAALALADRGVRTSIVRLSPSVHDRTKAGFANVLLEIARRAGFSGYVGDEGHWPAVHVQDAALLFQLALEKAPAGSILHGVGEESVSVRETAELIGRVLDVPVREVAPEKAMEHFGFLGQVIGANVPASSAITQRLLDWTPSHPTLFDDLENGQFTALV